VIGALLRLWVIVGGFCPSGVVPKVKRFFLLWDGFCWGVHRVGGFEASLLYCQFLFQVFYLGEEGDVAEAA